MVATAEKLRSGTFKYVESELYCYYETKKEIARLRAEILHGSPMLDENVGGGRSNLPGDPTGKVATVLATHRRLRRLEEIVEAIENVYNQLPTEKRRIVELRYWKRPRLLTWEGIAREVHVSRRQVFRWRDEIVFAIAMNLGLR